MSESASSDEGPVVTCAPPQDFGHYQFCIGVPDATGACVCGPECQQETERQYSEHDCCGSCVYEYGGTECSEVLDGQCCFVAFVVEVGCGEGRPFVVDDRARLAAVAARRGWTSSRTGTGPELTALDTETRARLAARWLATARAEHASIASFARFTLQLLAHGAPSDLVADAQRAALDEVEHARLAFALASAYGGASWGPGGLDLEDGLAEIGDPAAVLRSLVREGCVDETIAATEAAFAAEIAEDPCVRRALARVARDEARHAALAWRAARWMLDRWPALATVAAAALEHAIAQRRGTAHDDEASAGCPAHGMLGGVETKRAREQCIARTILPAMRTLLDAQRFDSRAAAS